jgi:hypothetical protein
MNKEFRMSRIGNKVYLNIPASVELDEYALEELILDLKNHLYNIKALNEAEQQNASKLELEKKMKEVFVDIFDTDGISSENVTIKTPNKIG